MAGGAPVPIPVEDPDDVILSIADLEKAASRKLGKTAGGMLSDSFIQVQIFRMNGLFVAALKDWIYATSA